MSVLDGLLAGIVADTREETRWLVLADWLDEFDDPRRAELLRLHRKVLATCCEPAPHPGRAQWQARMVALLAAGVRPCVPQETVTLPGGVGMTFSFIPPGPFLMGSDHAGGYDETKPVHRVTLTHGFFSWVLMRSRRPSGRRSRASRLPPSRVTIGRSRACRGATARSSVRS